MDARDGVGQGRSEPKKGFSLGSPAMGHAGNLRDVGCENDDYGEQGMKAGLNSAYGANRLMVERLLAGRTQKAELLIQSKSSQITHTWLSDC